MSPLRGPGCPSLGVGVNRCGRDESSASANGLLEASACRASQTSHYPVSGAFRSGYAQFAYRPSRVPDRILLLQLVLVGRM